MEYNPETCAKIVLKLAEKYPDILNELTQEMKHELSHAEPSEEEPSHEETSGVVKKMVPKKLNTRRCGLCKEIGHYRNNCPKTTHLPMKQTSTWNAKHKEHTLAKYKCPCGKQEMNKCNLDRHQRNHNCLKIFA
jgi:hypothetical protein